MKIGENRLDSRPLKAFPRLDAPLLACHSLPPVLEDGRQAAAVPHKVLKPGNTPQKAMDFQRFSMILMDFQWIFYRFSMDFYGCSMSFNGI